MGREKYNKSGCKDLTTYHAVEHMTAEEKRFREMIKFLRYFLQMAGFVLKERIVVRDRKTGRVWR